MNKQIEVSDYILPGVVSVGSITWKRVPGYLNVYASTGGLIAGRKANGLFKILPSREMKTTKGSYLYVKVLTDDLASVTKPIHGLVSLAFYGTPPKDGKRYEPNHIDGNKHNNRPNNLEWVTRSQNVQHAFDTGLCISGLRIEAINVITKEVKKYNSLNKMSKEWGIERYILRRIIARHRDEPYLGEWIFILDDTDDKKINRYQSQDIIYKDYVTGNVTICRDSEVASKQTGIKGASINARTRGRVKIGLSLLGRYVFQLLRDFKEWPEYSKEEAEVSENKYFEKDTKRTYIACVMKDYTTDSIYTGKSFNEIGKCFEELKGFSKGNLQKLFNKRELKLCKGVVVKELSDQRNWPEYSEEEIKQSMVSSNVPVLLTDVLSNTTKLYNTKAELMRDTGFSEVKVNRYLATNDLINSRYTLRLFIE